MQVLKGAHAEVVAPGRQALFPCFDLEATGLGHLELEVHVEGRGQDVVPGTEVGRGGGHPDQAPAIGHALIAST